ncbi:MAG: GTPase Era [Gammaproteobacteria bacterium RIFCSPHIGHO2_12_FULL_45_9]|nr:MAG: GTPase Era [Gammaproteobacteria bacterium RIFCSPHIGHO2_12_FULL_45_9]
MSETRCGYIAIVGRPNVGKSTLLNRILGVKLSITSRKPQTTRHRLLGIKTVDQTQWVYVDTPGLHRGEKKALNKHLNRAAKSALQDVDVLLWLVEANRLTEDDEWILKLLSTVSVPVILVVNKIDHCIPKERLLPFLSELSEKRQFAAIVPIAARLGEQVSVLEDTIAGYLPHAPFFFAESELTDRSTAFLITERVREKLMRQLGQEVPYELTVTLEALETTEKLVKASAIIWVDKDSQKPMVIGEGGARLKRVGQEARLELETLLGVKLFLKLWVKVKSGWFDNEQSLRQMGYEE